MSLHFVLFPFMAQGHMIPMVDIAKLLAHHGVTITIITTPYNAQRFKPVIDRAVQSGLPISLVQLKFPSEKADLPEGQENIDLLVSMDLSMINFFKAASFLEEPVVKLIEDMNPRPDCIIADMCLPYTTNVAKRFNIPKILFHGMGSFCLLCTYVLRKSKTFFDSIESESEYFVVPDFPDKVEFTKAQVPLVSSFTDMDWKDLFDEIAEADITSYGVIVNTFQELEPDYVKEYKKAREGRVWCIGPVSLCNKLGLDIAERGNRAAIAEDKCLKWLDSQEPGSVLYVCLGSLCNLPQAQLMELGLGLEESARPFIWVIRSWEKYGDLEKWIQESGFEERINGRGLLIKGWAPQVMILSHSSVGGFLTHCGWNSTLEGISAGLPLLTWPLFGDQFCNEKLVVEILRVGVRAGVEIPMKWGEEDKIGALVDREGVKSVVGELMGEGVEAEERRKRAKLLGGMAKRAVEEGGSSLSNIELLIQDIMLHKQNK